MAQPTRKLYRCNRPSCQKKERGRFFTNLGKGLLKCPQCNLDADDPQFGHMIQRLVIVHFDPPTEFPGLGQHRRACNSEAAIQVQDNFQGSGQPCPWHAGTGSAKAVNCDGCMKTEPYKAAMQVIEDDEPAEIPKLAPSAAAALDRLEFASQKRG